MPKDMVVMKRNGETLMGDIEEDAFTIETESVGQVTRRQKEITWILLGQYGKKNGDEVMLQDDTQLVGKVVNSSIHIKLGSSDEKYEIAIDKIRTIKFNLP